MPTQFPTIIESSDLNGTTGFSLNGVAADDYSGRSVSAAGDINGDGVDDLIIGAFGADPNGSNSGQSYVVFGGVSVGASGTLELSSLNGVTGFRLNGVAAFDGIGISVSAAGDINADGADDLIIGAYRADPNGSNSGQSYVVFGSPNYANPLTITMLPWLVSQGLATPVTSSQLNVATSTSNDHLISFHILNSKNINFELSANPLVPISRFTQAQVKAGEVIYRQDDSTTTPSFAVKMSAPVPALSSYSYYGPMSANVTLNLRPILFNNQLIVQEGQKVAITANELSATDFDNDNDLLTFVISNSFNGHFEINTTPGVKVSSFTQGQVASGMVAYLQDGSQNEPIYQVAVSDGLVSTSPAFAAITFIPTDDVPIITSNNFLLNAVGSTIINNQMLAATDEETANSDLVFNITMLQNGHFERLNQAGKPILNFVQGEVLAGQIQLSPTSHATLPSFNISVSDNLLTSQPQAARVSLTSNQNLVVSQGKSNAVRNAIIGSTVSGFVGLMFLALKIYIKKKTDKQMQKALAGEGDGVEGQQAVYFRNVISPIANKIFKRIKIRGFTGLSDKKLEAYLDAVARIVAECHEKGVPVDNLAAMNARNQRALIDEIAKHTKQTLVPESGMSSSVTGFFKAQTSPAAMETAAPMIASLVKASWNATQERARGYSQAQGIEMTSLGGTSTIDTSRDNPIFERTMPQTSLVGTGAGVGVGAVMTTSTQDVPAKQYNVAELLAGFREEFIGEIESLRTENSELKQQLEELKDKQNLSPPIAPRPKI